MKKYLIIGSGRVARHFEHYFTLQRIPCQTWSRKQNSVEELKSAFSHTDVTLVLISDSSIEEFIKQHAFLRQKPVVHFSGQLVTDLAVGLHPLNTFSNGRYDLETYQKTPFIGEKGRLSFTEIFPSLPNAHYEIEVSQKKFYHALCVISGNFTTILWEKTASEFEKLGLPNETLRPYLETTARNLLHSHNHSVLTGPLARKDAKTIHAHLEALAGDPFQKIYKSFVEAFQPESLK